MMDVGCLVGTAWCGLFRTAFRADFLLPIYFPLQPIDLRLRFSLMAKRNKSIRVKRGLRAGSTKPFFLDMDARLKELTQDCFVGSLKLNASAAILMYCRLDRIQQVEAMDAYLAYSGEANN